MTKEEENKKTVTLLAEIIYELYKDLKNGKLKNEICSVNKRAVGKSVTESQTFHQTAFKYKE